MSEHIEDKLAALAAKATQGRWSTTPQSDGSIMIARESTHRIRPVCFVLGSDDFGTEGETDAAYIAGLHNAASALLAVVRAARNRSYHCWDGPCSKCEGKCDVGVALSALDAVEV